MNAPTFEPVSGMDDDQLIALLRDTFASREDLADVYTAHRIALTPTPPPRRRGQFWLTAGAVAAAVAVVAGVGVAVLPSYGPSDSSAGAGLSHLPLAAPTGSTVMMGPAAGPVGLVPGPSVLHVPYPTQREIDAASQAEVAALSAETARFLTKRLHGRAVPAGQTPGALHGMSAVPATGTKQRTGYWAVPGSLTEVAAYLKQHHPGGTSATNGWGAGSGSDTPENYTFEYDAPATDAYALAQVGVVAMQSGSTTYLRTDSYLAERWARSAQTVVAAPVAQVEVRLTVGVGGKPVTETVTDDATIAKLVSAVNALPGSLRIGQVWGCVAQSSHLSLTFTLGSGGTVVADELIGCGPGTVSVTDDGNAVTPELDGTGFEAKIDRLVPQVAPQR